MHPLISKLEDIPNIGISIASDLRGIGILRPQQLAKHDPLAVYFSLAERMGHRHYPCVLYALLAAKHFMGSGERSLGGSSPHKEKGYSPRIQKMEVIH